MFIALVTLVLLSKHISPSHGISTSATGYFIENSDNGDLSYTEVEHNVFFGKPNIIKVNNNTEWTLSECSYENEIIAAPDLKCYYKCIDNSGQLIPQKIICRKGQTLDVNLEKCIKLPGNGYLKCIIRNWKCPDGLQGIIPHPNLEKKDLYIQCKENDVYILKCMEYNQIFDDNKKTCITIKLPTILHSDESEGKVEPITCTKPEIILKHPSLKEQCFYNCMLGHLQYELEIQCPKINYHQGDDSKEDCEEDATNDNVVMERGFRDDAYYPELTEGPNNPFDIDYLNEDKEIKPINHSDKHLENHFTTKIYDQEDADEIFHIPDTMDSKEYLSHFTTRKIITPTTRFIITVPTTSEDTLPKDEITTPKDVITTPKDVITTPKDEITTPKDEITTPKDEITTPKDEITTPKDEITTPKDEITTPKDEITTPKDEITTPEDEITTPKDEITTPKDEITSPKDEITTPKDEITTPKETIATVIDIKGTPPDQINKTTEAPNTNILVTLEFEEEDPWPDKNLISEHETHKSTIDMSDGSTELKKPLNFFDELFKHQTNKPFEWNNIFEHTPTQWNNRPDKFKGYNFPNEEEDSKEIYPLSKPNDRFDHTIKTVPTKEEDGEIYFTHPTKPMKNHMENLDNNDNDEIKTQPDKIKEYNKEEVSKEMHVQSKPNDRFDHTIKTVPTHEEDGEISFTHPTKPMKKLRTTTKQPESLDETFEHLNEELPIQPTKLNNRLEHTIKTIPTKEEDGEIYFTHPTKPMENHMENLDNDDNDEIITQPDKIKEYNKEEVLKEMYVQSKPNDRFDHTIKTVPTHEEDGEISFTHPTKPLKKLHTTTKQPESLDETFEHLNEELPNQPTKLNNRLEHTIKTIPTKEEDGEISFTHPTKPMKKLHTTTKQPESLDETFEHLNEELPNQPTKLNNRLEHTIKTIPTKEEDGEISFTHPTKPMKKLRTTTKQPESLDETFEHLNEELPNQPTKLNNRLEHTIKTIPTKEQDGEIYFTHPTKPMENHMKTDLSDEIILQPHKIKEYNFPNEEEDSKEISPHQSKKHQMKSNLDEIFNHHKHHFKWNDRFDHTIKTVPTHKEDGEISFTRPTKPMKQSATTKKQSNLLDELFKHLNNKDPNQPSNRLEYTIKTIPTKEEDGEIYFTHPTKPMKQSATTKKHSNLLDELFKHLNKKDPNQSSNRLVYTIKTIPTKEEDGEIYFTHPTKPMKQSATTNLLDEVFKHLNEKHPNQPTNRFEHTIKTIPTNEKDGEIYFTHPTKPMKKSSTTNKHSNLLDELFKHLNEKYPNQPSNNNRLEYTIKTIPTKEEDGEIYFTHPTKPMKKSATTKKHSNLLDELFKHLNEKHPNQPMNRFEHTIKTIPTTEEDGEIYFTHPTKPMKKSSTTKKHPNLYDEIFKHPNEENSKHGTKWNNIAQHTIKTIPTNEEDGEIYFTHPTKPMETHITKLGVDDDDEIVTQPNKITEYNFPNEEEESEEIYSKKKHPHVSKELRHDLSKVPIKNTKVSKEASEEDLLTKYPYEELSPIKTKSTKEEDGEIYLTHPTKPMETHITKLGDDDDDEIITQPAKITEYNFSKEEGDSEEIYSKKKHPHVSKELNHDLNKIPIKNIEVSKEASEDLLNEHPGLNQFIHHTNHSKHPEVTIESSDEFSEQPPKDHQPKVPIHILWNTVKPTIKKSSEEDVKLPAVPWDIKEQVHSEEQVTYPPHPVTWKTVKPTERNNNKRLQWKNKKFPYSSEEDSNEYATITHPTWNTEKPTKDILGGLFKSPVFPWDKPHNFDKEDKKDLKKSHEAAVIYQDEEPKHTNFYKEPEDVEPPKKLIDYPNERPDLPKVPIYIPHKLLDEIFSNKPNDSNIENVPKINFGFKFPDIFSHDAGNGGRNFDETNSKEDKNEYKNWKPPNWLKRKHEKPLNYYHKIPEIYAVSTPPGSDEEVTSPSTIATEKHLTIEPPDSNESSDLSNTYHKSKLHNLGTETTTVQKHNIEIPDSSDEYNSHVIHTLPTWKTVKPTKKNDKNTHFTIGEHEVSEEEVTPPLNKHYTSEDDLSEEAVTPPLNKHYKSEELNLSEEEVTSPVTKNYSDSSGEEDNYHSGKEHGLWNTETYIENSEEINSEEHDPNASFTWEIIKPTNDLQGFFKLPTWDLKKLPDIEKEKEDSGEQVTYPSHPVTWETVKPTRTHKSNRHISEDSDEVTKAPFLWKTVKPTTKKIFNTKNKHHYEEGLEASGEEITPKTKAYGFESDEMDIDIDFSRPKPHLSYKINEPTTEKTPHSNEEHSTNDEVDIDIDKIIKPHSTEKNPHSFIHSPNDPTTTSKTTICKPDDIDDAIDDNSELTEYKDYFTKIKPKTTKPSKKKKLCKKPSKERNDESNSWETSDERPRHHHDSYKTKHYKKNKSDGMCIEKGTFRFKNSCTKYYKCIESKGYFTMSKLYKCPSCMKFNAALAKCDWPQNVPECLPNNYGKNRLCTGHGHFPIPKEPHKFYKCKTTEEGEIKLNVITCTHRRQFNPHTRRCDKHYHSKGYTPRCKHENEFIVDKCNCARAYVCKKKKVQISITCPSGYIFNTVSTHNKNIHCARISESRLYNWGESSILHARK